MLVLTALSFSPWSEKARWALDHHHLDYKEEPFVPLVGELALRLRMQRFSGRVTVPVLQDGLTWFTDSFDIARYADRLGQGPRLFPDDRLAEISEWNQRSEAALAAGRALLMLAMENDAKFALGLLPIKPPAVLKPLLVPIAKKGVQAFIKKYRMRDAAGQHQAVFTGELERLAKAVAGRRYLLGDSLTYADIAMTTVVQGISPVDERYLARVPGAGNNPQAAELQRRYAELVAWRDQLYTLHRKPRNRSA